MISADGRWLWCQQTGYLPQQLHPRGPRDRQGNLPSFSVLFRSFPVTLRSSLSVILGHFHCLLVIMGVNRLACERATGKAMVDFDEKWRSGMVNGTLWPSFAWSTVGLGQVE